MTSLELPVSRRLLEYNPILETVDGAAFAREAEVLPFAEGEAMALASELLEVEDEAALGRYLRRLVSRAAILGKRPVASKVAPLLVVELRRVVWPLFAERAQGAAGLLGGWRGPDPALQGARLFGLELEGLSPEDQEFALAQQVVRFVSNAAGNAAGQRGTPQAVAIEAVRRAARRDAPGLLPRLTLPATQGMWRRVGGRIVVFVP